MTEVTHYEQTTGGRLVAIPAPQVEYLAPAMTDPTGGRLVAWADGLAAAHRIGAALCQTAFVPQAFRNKPEECAAAILFGDEIGLTPTQSLRSVYTVSGTPGLYARAMVALVLAAGHEVWTVSKSDSSVTVAGRRRGSSHVIEETWTTARATKAGYTNNKKYTSDPQAMLYARAAADVCRQVAPDALAGLAYTVEELELADAPTTTVTRSERKTTAKRAAAPAVPEPPLDPPAEAATADVIDEAEVVADEPQHPETDGHFQAMQIKLRERFGSDRDAVLAWVGTQIGREIASTKDMDGREVGDVLAILSGRRAEVADQ